MLTGIFVRANDNRQVEVRLSNEIKFGPQQAIAAANIAFGPFSYCDVSHRQNGEHKQYRVTGSSDKRRARRIK